MGISAGHLPLKLSRSQILAFRRGASALDERLPMSSKSLRLAAWAGLQDSMPRAALLSIHARVNGTGPATWENSSLVQLWGPRFSNYVVAARDLPLFSLGRLPTDAKRYARAIDTASRLRTALEGRRMPFGDVAHEMGGHPNSLRYAAPTGTVLIRWDGARQPVIWSVPQPAMDPQVARLELARRYFHIFGPTTLASFVQWAGIKSVDARLLPNALGDELMAVRTPVGEAWILAGDEANLRAKPKPAAPARLLPSGDTYYLLWNDDRKLLVPEAKHRAALWTSRVWPGALLVNGEIVGVWRRAAHEVAIETWRRLSPAERKAMEAEALSLPIPALEGSMIVSWT